MRQTRVILLQTLKETLMHLGKRGFELCQHIGIEGTPHFPYQRRQSLPLLIRHLVSMADKLLDRILQNLVFGHTEHHFVHQFLLFQLQFIFQGLFFQLAVLQLHFFLLIVKQDHNNAKGKDQEANRETICVPVHLVPHLQLPVLVFEIYALTSQFKFRLKQLPPSLPFIFLHVGLPYQFQVLFQRNVSLFHIAGTIVQCAFHPDSLHLDQAVLKILRRAHG